MSPFSIPLWSVLRAPIWYMVHNGLTLGIQGSQSRASLYCREGAAKLRGLAILVIALTVPGRYFSEESQRSQPLRRPCAQLPQTLEERAIVPLSFWRPGSTSKPHPEYLKFSMVKPTARSILPSRKCTSRNPICPESLPKWIHWTILDRSCHLLSVHVVCNHRIYRYKQDASSLSGPK